uniref:Uncharacterized protein n=1 Tax=Cannabis sativa TaxID=3483 RepID=A0A803P6D9_CANSA
MRKIAGTDPHMALHATMSSTEYARPAAKEKDDEGDAEEEGAALPLRFGGYNKVWEPVSEAGDVLEEGEDYVTEEYTEAVPQRRQGASRAWWVSPPSIITQAQLRSLEKDGYLGGVECFFPSPNHPGN